MARHFHRCRKTIKSKRKLLKKRTNNKQIHINDKITKAKTFVRNLSGKHLTNNEYLLLAKGIKYIISPSNKLTKKEIIKDFDEFSRKLRCMYLFEDGTKYEPHPFYTNTGYKPKTSCNAIENYIFATKLELSKLSITKRKSNITKAELEALKSLQNNNDIVIRKADKNSTLCVLNKENYIKEGLRQLNDNIHYEEITQPKTTEIVKRVSEMIETLYSEKKIDDITKRYINAEINNKNLGKFFLLPKLHKIDNKIIDEIETNYPIRKDLLIPGRPIVSLCGTPLHNLGHFIDYILLPFVQKQDTYLKDTTDFINKIENTRVPQNTYLITFDAVGMYNQFRYQEILNSVSNVLNNISENQYKIPIPNKETILEFIKIILENNEFTFNNKIYKQKLGVPMGGSLSAELADIRMYEILKNILLEFEHKDKIITCYRYRDDGFLLYKGSVNEIKDFFDLANRSHEYLKFTYEYSNKEITFLDTEIYKGSRFSNESVFDIRTHIKKTETFQYLERTSAHPTNVFKAFIKGEIIRYIRNTSDTNELEKITKSFKNRLINRNYKEQEIQEVIENIINKNRNELLKRSKVDKEKPLAMVTKYNPAVKQLKRKLIKHWKLILMNEDCKDLFNNRPIVAYKRNKNLQELVTKAKV